MYGMLRNDKQILTGSMLSERCFVAILSLSSNVKSLYKIVLFCHSMILVKDQALKSGIEATVPNLYSNTFIEHLNGKPCMQ